MNMKIENAILKIAYFPYGSFSGIRAYIYVLYVDDRGIRVHACVFILVHSFLNLHSVIDLFCLLNGIYLNRAVKIEYVDYT